MQRMVALAGSLGGRLPFEPVDLATRVDDDRVLLSWLDFDV